MTRCVACKFPRVKCVCIQGMPGKHEIKSWNDKVVLSSSEFELPLTCPKRVKLHPQFLHLSAAIFIRQPWWRSFWFASSSPSKARGPRRLQTSNFKFLPKKRSENWRNIQKTWSVSLILIGSSGVSDFGVQLEINKNPSIASHLEHQLCRLNGPESRLQVEPRAELQQLQQTMKPTELQSDAPRGRPPLAVQRQVMPPTSPQGPSSPSGIDNLGQQDADRRRPGPPGMEESFRSFFQ